MSIQLVDCMMLLFATFFHFPFEKVNFIVDSQEVQPHQHVLAQESTAF